MGKVALKIFQAGKEGTHFSELVRDLEGEVSRMTVNKVVDQLLDAGVIKGFWIKKELSSRDGNRLVWVRCFTTSGEHAEECLRLLQVFTEKTRLEV